MRADRGVLSEEDGEERTRVEAGSEIDGGGALGETVFARFSGGSYGSVLEVGVWRFVGSCP